MVFLRGVSIHNKKYYYLYHLVKPKKDSEKKLIKFKKYIGTKEPSSEKLKELKNNFLLEIKEHPEHFRMKENQNVIMLLQEIQAKKSFIPEDHIVKLSKELNIPAIELFGVISFYSQFKLVKPGKYKVKICRGTACHVKGSDSLLKYVQNLLKIKPGETTTDGKFSLDAVNCIGACALAPAMMVNEKIYGNLTEEKIKKLIIELRQK